MKLSQIMCCVVGALFFIAVTGCLGSSDTPNNNASINENAAITGTDTPTEISTDIVVDEANATLLPEDDSTIIVNATVVESPT